MFKKTDSQLQLDIHLTEKLNSDDSCALFTMLCLQLLENQLKEITWDERFDDKPYWFYVEGDSALRLLYKRNNQEILMPAILQWQCQLVINPAYNEQLWQVARNKINDAIDQGLTLCNMILSLLPNMQTLLTETVPQSCSQLDLISSLWYGSVNYSDPEDRDYLCLSQSGEVTLYDTLCSTCYHVVGERTPSPFSQLSLWKRAAKALFDAAAFFHWSDADRHNVESNWAHVRWRLERVGSANRQSALDDLSAYFGVTLDTDATNNEINDQLQSVLSGSGLAALSCKRHVAYLNEGDLFQLQVRYHYQPPTVLANNKSAADYEHAWSRNGDLASSLFSIAIAPRNDGAINRDSYGLINKLWQVENIAIAQANEKTLVLPVQGPDYSLDQSNRSVRKILAGQCRHYDSLQQQLLHCYNLGNQGSNNNAGRTAARTQLIDLNYKIFTQSYHPLLNNSVNQLIHTSCDALKQWNESADENSAKTLATLFAAQLKSSTGQLKQSGLSDEQLSSLHTFPGEPKSVADYPNIWGGTEDENQQQSNAGALDALYIIAIYAQLALEVEGLLKESPLTLGPEQPVRETSTNELIKYICHAYNNDKALAQVTHQAATYCYLQQLDGFTGTATTGSSVLPSVTTVDLEVIYHGDVAVINQKTEMVLKQIGRALVRQRNISRFETYHADDEHSWGLNVTIGRQRPRTYFRIRIQSHNSSHLVARQYCNGMPVIALEYHIARLRASVENEEYLMSVAAKHELDELSVRLK